MPRLNSLLYLSLVLPFVSSHSAFFHPSMYGFNVTSTTFPYDNRPVSPLRNYTFSQWWFHGHLDYPPNPTDFFLLPAGGVSTAEISCDKGATSYFASADADIRDPNDPDNPCPGQGRGPQTYHTTGLNDTKGCALAIAYESDVGKVKPEDFTVFSVNQTCVWTRFTDFEVPERMPPCPPGGCTCAFFWIHGADSGAEENYMNGFKCNVTGSTSNAGLLATPQIPRRCGSDPSNNKLQNVPANCTYGAKQPFYWFNLEQNNMFEGAFSPPVYNDQYNFLDGAQNDIFIDSYEDLPDPSPVALLPTLSEISLIIGGGNVTNSVIELFGRTNTTEKGRSMSMSSRKKRRAMEVRSGAGDESRNRDFAFINHSKRWSPVRARRRTGRTPLAS